MDSLKLMEVGYNLVERAFLGKEFEEMEDRLSIIEFLRRLKRRQRIKPRICVTGLDEALIGDESVAEYIREILVESTNILRTCIVQFPLNGSLIFNRTPKIKYKGREISLTPIFGNRITMKSMGFFHSPVNI